MKLDFLRSLALFAFVTILSTDPHASPPQVFTPTGPNSSTARSPRQCIDSGDVAYNRETALAGFPIPSQLSLLGGCSPHPILEGWTPLKWPKYDGFRDVVFVSRALLSGHALYTIDCAGNAEPVTIPGLPGFYPEGVAPTGDGRVYLMSTVLWYLDADDVPHVVHGPDGTPFTWPGIVTDMVYDRVTNALIVLSSTIGTSGPCTPALHANAVVTKIPLDATGDNVVPPLSTYTFCVGENDSYVPRIARHPDGRLLFRVSRSDSPDVEVVWLDTRTMTPVWFCTQQLAPGSAFQWIHGKHVSAFSARHGGIVSVTQNIPCGPGCTPTATLRVYAEGSIGIGTPVCAWQNEGRSLFVDFVP